MNRKRYFINEGSLEITPTVSLTEQDSRKTSTRYGYIFIRINSVKLNLLLQISEKDLIL